MSNAEAALRIAIATLSLLGTGLIGMRLDLKRTEGYFIWLAGVLGGIVVGLVVQPILFK